MRDRIWVKRPLAVLILSLVLPGCSLPALTPPTTPTPSPLDTIKALEAAMNEEDTDAALDLFVDEGLSFSVAGLVAADKEMLRWVLDSRMALSDRDEWRDCQQQGETVTCTGLNRSICGKAEGVEVIHVPTTFTFQDQKIRSMVGDIVSDEGRVLEAGAAKLHSWAVIHRPEEQEIHLHPESAGLTGREYGELVAELCRDYLEATGQ